MNAVALYTTPPLTSDVCRKNAKRVLAALRRAEFREGADTRWVVDDLCLDDARPFSIRQQDEINTSITLFRWRNIVSESISTKHLDYEDFTRPPCGSFLNRHHRALRRIKYRWFAPDSHDASLPSRRNHGIIFTGFIEFVRELVRTVHHVLHLHVFAFASNEIHAVRPILRLEGQMMDCALQCRATLVDSDTTWIGAFEDELGFQTGDAFFASRT